MNSSDSDEDCYGNVAQKLQLLKNKYQKEKFLPNNSLNDSTRSLTSSKVMGNYSNTSAILIEDENTDFDGSEEITIDSIIAKNIKKRVTRSTSKYLQIDAFLEKPLTRNSKTKPMECHVAKKANCATRKTIETSPKRGRGGRRKQAQRSGRKSRGRVSQIAPEDVQNIPTYSIGNTDYYPDYSNNQQLFNTEKPIDTIILEEDAGQSINEELSVKVIWQSSECEKFTIRKYQKLTVIYDFYAEKEKVPHNKLIFMYNDKIIKSDDTPATINYNIVKFIEGGITSENMCGFMTKRNIKIKNGLKLKFQCENIKKPFEINVKANDNLSLAMIQCAEHFEIPLQKLKFIFDGDILSSTNTPSDLELEGGECIDVKIVN